MSIEDSCFHKFLYYNPHSFDKGETTLPAYTCNDCKQKLLSTYYGGSIDVSEYTASVVGYNGLKLERTKPKEQLRLKI